MGGARDPDPESRQTPNGGVPGVLQSGLPPVVDAHARLLILGSFPGVASLSEERYYAHPRNAFWTILGRLLGEPLAQVPYAQRLRRMTGRGIALWDAVGACRRRGSLDADIRDARTNDLVGWLSAHPGIRAVAFNGATAARIEPAIRDRVAVTYRMPSTSPAHAALSLEQKYLRWRILVDDGWLPGPVP